MSANSCIATTPAAAASAKSHQSPSQTSPSTIGSPIAATRSLESQFGIDRFSRIAACPVDARAPALLRRRVTPVHASTTGGEMETIRRIRAVEAPLVRELYREM